MLDLLIEIVGPILYVLAGLTFVRYLYTTDNEWVKQWDEFTQFTTVSSALLFWPIGIVGWSLLSFGSWYVLGGVRKKKHLAAESDTRKQERITVVRRHLDELRSVQAKHDIDLSLAIDLYRDELKELLS